MSTSPKSPTSLERLFKSNIRMSPSRSRKQIGYLNSRRAALNRAAYTLAEIKEMRRKRDELTYKILKLEQEYYKLARRAAFISNANMRSGPLNPTERNRLRRAVAMTKNLSTAVRVAKHGGLPYNLQNKIAKLTLPKRR